MLRTLGESSGQQKKKRKSGVWKKMITGKLEVEVFHSGVILVCNMASDYYDSWHADEWSSTGLSLRIIITVLSRCWGRETSEVATTSHSLHCYIKESVLLYVYLLIHLCVTMPVLKGEHLAAYEPGGPRFMCRAAAGATCFQALENAEAVSVITQSIRCQNATSIESHQPLHLKSWNPCATMQWGILQWRETTSG